jgi:hypothetical protein
MARSAWAQREAIDARVERLAPQWPPRRQPGVDRSLIRLAVWELSNGGTPPKVVIDEAIEMAKAFSTEQSPAFVNGVLDAVLKENRTLRDEGSGFSVQGSVADESTPPAEAAVAERPPTSAPVEPTVFIEAGGPYQPGARALTIVEILDTDLRPLFSPERRVDDDFMADLKLRLLDAGVSVDDVRRLGDEVRRRRDAGDVRTADEAGVFIRDQLTRAHGSPHLNPEP